MVLYFEAKFRRIREKVGGTKNEWKPNGFEWHFPQLCTLEKCTQNKMQRSH